MIVLVIGGTRSGKSDVAERIAATIGEPVTVIVPASDPDPDLADRIDAHRSRRPASWTTIECGPNVVPALESAAGTAIVDSLGTWIAAAPDLEVNRADLARALQGRRASTVIVTEEVGLAVHPPTEVGRRFTDALGALNREVAEVSDHVLLVVAGRVLRLHGVDDMEIG